MLSTQFDNTAVENAHERFTCTRYHSGGIHLTVTETPGEL